MRRAVDELLPVFNVPELDAVVAGHRPQDVAGGGVESISKLCVCVRERDRKEVRKEECMSMLHVYIGVFPTHLSHTQPSPHAMHTVYV